jgi:cell division protein FtsI (penicillin-binding protein 3)
MTASPVQLAAGLATLANGGVRMQPYLVDAVLDRDGAVETRRDPRIDRRVVSEDVARTVTAMMETVTEDGGTGTRARVPGYRVAGKTGTAQKVENGVYSATKRVSSFVGFLPADRPEIAIAVSVDSPTIGSKYGGIVAAPVFSEIGAFAMRYLGVAPDPGAAPSALTEGAPVEEAPAVAALEIVSDGEGGWILPDLRGRSLRDALAGLGPAGLTLQVDGYGRIAEQSPPPGARVVPGDAVHLRFN